MNGIFLYDVLIYLTAAVVFVPIAKKLGMGSVPGYLLGGIIIGPFFLGFVGEEGKDIMHFAEFGVAIMLFLIGLELEPATLWRMRKLILGTGAFQMGATTLLCFAALLLAGFGHFGSTIGRFLRANGITATILDNDSDRVEILRKMGFTVFYGDATRLDILKSAGADEAKTLIAAIDSPEINLELIDRVRKEFPKLEVMVRAKNRMDAYDLLDIGIEDIYRESLDTSVRLGVDVLIKLGFRKYSATRAGQNFIKYDDDAWDGERRES